MTLDPCANEVQLAFQVMSTTLYRTRNVFVFLEEWKRTVKRDVAHQCRVQQTCVSGRVSLCGS